MNLPPVVCEKLRLKLLSLLCSAALWVFVTLQGGDELEMPLQVQFVNIPTGAVLRTAAVPRLSVRISGPRILLLHQKFRGVTASLDLAGTTVGRVEFAGLERFVRLDDGLRTLRVSPGKLTVELDNPKTTVMQ
jgi:hypothetical protein